MGIILNAIGIILDKLIFIYSIIIFISAVLNLARADTSSTIYQILYKLTNPVYDMIRRIVRTEFNGIEFAPLILIVILQFINLTIVRLLIEGF